MLIFLLGLFFFVAHEKAVDAKTAQQHVRQIKNVIGQPLDGNHRADLLLDKGHILDTFLDGYAVQRQYQPGTIRSHLTSLCHLYDFWLLTSACPDHRKHQVTLMKQTIKRWMTSYRKNANQRKLEKLDKDLQKIITPDDVCKFSQSQTARDALKILGAASQNTERDITKQEYTMVRDYLLSATILRNANRPGVLASVTIRALKEAKIINDHFVLSIPCHKTSSVHRPAKLVLTKLLHTWLMLFVSTFLPQIPAACESDLVFRSWNGEPVDNIGRCFQATLKKAGLHDITCTLFRKSAVSTVHQHCPTEKANLADLIGHRQKTATRWYRIVDKEQTSVHAAAKMAEVMNNDEAVSHSPMTDVNASYEQEEVPDTVRPTDSSTSVGCPENTESVALIQRKKMFTDNEIRMITKCCSDIIDGGTMKRIVLALSRHEDGVRILKHYTIVQR